MPSIDDVFNELKAINTNLQAVQNQLGALNGNVTGGFTSVTDALNALVSLASYADSALSHISKQDDTLICILEKISKQTCSLLNEAHQQTEADGSMKHSLTVLVELFKTVHADAALEQHRLEEIRKEARKCCPPPDCPPPCTYEPCPAGLALPNPPTSSNPIQ